MPCRTLPFSSFMSHCLTLQQWLQDLPFPRFWNLFLRNLVKAVWAGDRLIEGPVSERDVTDTERKRTGFRPTSHVFQPVDAFNCAPGVAQWIGYGLDGPVFESLPETSCSQKHVQNASGAHAASTSVGTEVLFRCYSGRSVT